MPRWRKAILSFTGGLAGSIIGTIAGYLVLRSSISGESFMIVDPAVIFEFILIVSITTTVGLVTGFLVSRS